MIETSRDMHEALTEIGHLWRLGRPLSHGELARCLDLEPHPDSRRSHTDVGRDVCRRPTPPQRLVVQAMLEGFIPPGAPACARR